MLLILFVLQRREPTGSCRCLFRASGMVTPSLSCGLFRQIEPIVVLEQVGSALFDTALQMVVKERSANMTEESQQKAITDFYMIYNLIIKLCPIIPALALAALSDRGWRRAPIVGPLSGYLLSRLTLLLVLIFDLPLRVMFAAAVIYGLSGGFSAYWPGVMTLASLGSKAADRSKVGALTHFILK